MKDLDLRARVVDLHAEGMTQRAIAAQLGVSRGKVRRSLDAAEAAAGPAGLPGGPARRPKDSPASLAAADPDEQTREIVRLLVVDGQTQSEAARIVGVSVTTVLRRLASPLGLSLLSEARAALESLAGVELAVAGRIARQVLLEIACDEDADPRQRVAAASKVLGTAHDPKRAPVDLSAVAGAAAQGGAMGGAMGALGGADLAATLAKMQGRTFEDVRAVDLMAEVSDGP